MSTTIIAAENCHWYFKDGRPCYEVPYADPKKGMRKTTKADAVKLGLVPGYTEIENVIAKPGLQAWKLQQLLESALTLPRLNDETLDAFAVRVIEDSEAQSLRARERGTALHEAIEHYVLGEPFDRMWNNHILAVERTLRAQCGLDLVPADAEKTFATPEYGGKIDWKQGNAIADFKTKDRIEDGKRLAWDNHARQLAAYGNGCGIPCDGASRYLSIFIGVDDEQVRIFEWTKEDIEQGWRSFRAYLTAWQVDRKWKV